MSDNTSYPNRGTVISGAMVTVPGYAWGGGVLASQTISSGVTAIDTTIAGNVTSQYAAGPTMYYYSNVAMQTVESGGVVSGNNIGEEGSAFISNGAASYDSILQGVTSSITSGYNDPNEGWGWVEKTYTSTFWAYQNVAGYADNTSVQNGGMLVVSGIADHNNVSSGGVFSAASGATILNTTINSGGSLIVDSGATFRDPVSLASGAILTFTNLNGYPGDYSGQFVSNGAGGTMLEITSGNTIVESLPVTSGIDAPMNLLAATGNGLELALGTPCYCPGTLIATPGGSTPVEALRIGDTVVTASGQERPIRWIGERAYDPIFAHGNRDILPVTIKASALEDGVPARDLTISPLHAMFLDGLLIPVLHLVNRESIVQLRNPGDIRYIHIELDTHDLLLAEGAPSESFLDDGSRGMFHNASEYDVLYPDAPHVPPRYCAPRIESGPDLERVRRRIDARIPLIRKAA